MVTILLATAISQSSLPFLSPAFGSHMVLQRNKPNTFWGWSTPGDKVTVSVANKKATGTAGTDGKWVVRVSPPKVGGPYVVKVDGSQHVELIDVLVGDVWLCTGQSNMEMGLGAVENGPAEAANANDPNLRLFLVPKQTGLSPQKTVGGNWAVCTPESVLKDGWSGFSAVGYHFGKALRREVGIPIGLVEISWGGTNAESWTSREALKPLKDFDAWFPRIDETVAKGPQPVVPANKWVTDTDPGTKGNANWQNPDLNTADWKKVTVPDGFGGLGLNAFDGTAWFRKEITLTEAQAAAGGVLSLGPIDDEDSTWVNGQLVGGLLAWNEPRNYKIGAGILKAGRNVIAIRVTDTASTGGFSAKTEEMVLKLADGSTVPLGGDWLGHVGVAMPNGGGFTANMATDPNVPTTLSNGMLEPWVPFAIKGAIWYQGENNAGRAFQYRKVLPTMIGDWRKRFGQGDFPFYIVSLAAYMAHKPAPSQDDWAELREAQYLTSKNVNNTGLAITIDVGDPVDIHPKDKKTVGERLAKIALAKDYGQSIFFSGPVYRSMSKKGSQIVLTFDHAEGGLTIRGTELGEFSIAGADQKFHWATARIEGNTIVVSSPDVTQPVAVRYAWQANPVATLFNGVGLPAVPFRTDEWPGGTVGRK